LEGLQEVCEGGPLEHHGQIQVLSPTKHLSHSSQAGLIGWFLPIIPPPALAGCSAKALTPGLQPHGHQLFHADLSADEVAGAFVEEGRSGGKFLYAALVNYS
jgi:hypothetical protein